MKIEDFFDSRARRYEPRTHRHFNAGARVAAQAGEAGYELEKHGLAQGRMVSASKSAYEEQHPDHEVFFNGCIFVKERRLFRRTTYRQVWWGDIDLTESQAVVQAAADTLGQDLWVTRERYRWNGYNGETDSAVHFKHIA